MKRYAFARSLIRVFPLSFATPGSSTVRILSLIASLNIQGSFPYFWVQTQKTRGSKTVYIDERRGAPCNIQNEQESKTQHRII